MSTHSGYIWSRLIHIRGFKAIAFLLLTGGVFASIAVSIHLPGLASIDLAVTRGLQQYRSSAADIVFFTASFLGNSLTLILAGAAIASVLAIRKHPRAALLTLISLLGLPLNMVLKEWAERPRPDPDAVAILLPQIGLSFPSGHAMGSAVFYGYLATLAWLRMEPGPWRTVLTWTLAGLPIPIGLSRIYIGAHWLSDVIAGLAAGAFLLVPLVALYKHWHRIEGTEATA